MTDLSLIIDANNSRTAAANLAWIVTRLSGVSKVESTSENRLSITFEPQIIDTFELVSAVQAAGGVIRTESIAFPVGGMSCAACALHIETALTDQPGVITADLDMQKGVSFVTVVADSIKPATLFQAVRAAGYKVLPSAELARFQSNPTELKSMK